MKRVLVLAGLSAALAMSASVVHAQEIETFDSPDELQPNNSNFMFSSPIQGSFAPGKGGIITDHSTNVEISNASGGYGTAYKNIYFLDTPPAGSSNGVINIGDSNTLQLDLTITTGDAGPFVELDDGEGDSFQYFYGYGLVGTAALDVASQPGETIAQGAGSNELILDVPLATPYADLNGTGMFDFTQITDFRFSDDPGGAPSYDISLNDLSGVNVNTPEPVSLTLGAVGCLLLGRRRRS